MRLAIEHDRPVQLLLKADPTLGYDEARQRLERAALVISASAAAATAWGQAAVLTIAECATRMFRGGVYLARDFAEPVVVGNRMPATLQGLLVEMGCRRQAAPANAIIVHVGTDLPPTAKALRCWADGWTAVISPRPSADRPDHGNEISGALTGAMVASEAFRIQVLGDAAAGRRTQRLSPITPADTQAPAPRLEWLPARCRLLGLGNLGQATLWMLSLLPYADPGAVELVLQDTDTSGPENLDTQILTRFSWIGHKKARAAAVWAEAQGFKTVVNECRFTAKCRPSAEEPRLAFVGVDNLETRRAAAQAGFDLVVDAGLGATSAEVFDLRIHCFPGSRDALAAWPEMPPETERRLGPGLARLVEEGRLDTCGAMTIAGQAVGIPSTAVAAAAISIAQACRAIADGQYCDLVDVSVADVRRATAHEAMLPRLGVLPFTAARQLWRFGGQNRSLSHLVP
jgi:molybdopterin/thiamine biosynthesis adenylyltransferase